MGTKADGISYAQLLDQSRQGAAVVRANGVDRVALVDVNSDAVPVLLFASAIAGVPFLPSTTAWPTSACARSASGSPRLWWWQTRGRARLAGVAGSSTTYAELAERAARTTGEPGARTDPNHVAIWLFTSGTTGEPKAAVLRHRHLTSYVLSTVEFMAAGDDEATLVSVPPYHIAGMAAILSSSTPVAGSCTCRGSTRRTGSRSPSDRRSPTPWSCRRCSAGSST